MVGFIVVLGLSVCAVLLSNSLGSCVVSGTGASAEVINLVNSSDLNFERVVDGCAVDFTFRIYAFVTGGKVVELSSGFSRATTDGFSVLCKEGL